MVRERASTPSLSRRLREWFARGFLYGLWSQKGLATSSRTTASDPGDATGARLRVLNHADESALQQPAGSDRRERGWALRRAGQKLRQKSNSRRDCGKVADACSPILAANRSLAASVRSES